MTYNEAEKFILSLNNVPRREYMKDPAQCIVYLQRLQVLLDILGNPEKQIPHYIQVTGTSGKGSVCTFLHQILQAAEKKVGSITSPPPTYIYERWHVGNRDMTKKEFIDIVAKTKPKLDEYLQTSPYDMVSYEELMTVIGLVYLAKKKVDWAVIEVGCGGRYDSTNVIPWKNVAVITNIGLDHTEILGDTKEKIAYEKAGIIKSGANVFTMDTDQNVLKVIEEECKKTKTTLSQITKHVTQIKSNGTSTTFFYNGQMYALRTIGEHQIGNAILCINIAQSLGISESAIQKGLKNTIQPLRMEIVSKQPFIILDGAHNPDKIKTTIATIQQLVNLPTSQLANTHLLIGFSGDKDVANMIKQLSVLKPATIACTRNTTDPFRKVANPVDIQQHFKRLLPKTTVQTFFDPHAALAWSKTRMKKHDILLITGSIFLSGELRETFFS